MRPGPLGVAALGWLAVAPPAQAQRPTWVPPDQLVNRGAICRSPSVSCPPADGSAAPAVPGAGGAGGEAERMERERLRQARTACERQWGNLQSMVEHCERKAREGAAGPEGSPSTP